MEISVYRGDILAAVLVFGRPPEYNGKLGKAVKKLLESPRYIRNFWTGETSYGIPADDYGWEWWAASILSADLKAAGFHCQLAGIPEPAPLPEYAIG